MKDKGKGKVDEDAHKEKVPSPLPHSPRQQSPQPLTPVSSQPKELTADAKIQTKIRSWNSKIKEQLGEWLSSGKLRLRVKKKSFGTKY